MVVFAGLAATSAQRVLTAFLGDTYGSPASYSRLAPSAPQPTDELANQVNAEMFNLVAGPGAPDYVVGNVHAALFYDVNQPDWFENYHVVPRSFDFGNILSTQTSPLVVFSGYRKAFGTWSSFTNNAGAGTTLLGMPTLATVMNPLAGYDMTLEVSTNGNPTVDDDLAFVFDFGGTTISVPITLNRIVLFPIRPEIPYVEKLQFLTDIITHEDGSEQRIALRKNPRQLFEWDVRADDGDFDRSRLNTLMFDWQSRTWGVPMWHESTTLTSAATAGDLVINVGSTANADYRVDGLVMVYTDVSTFDVQTISSFTSTTITLSNALLNSFPLGATVAPLRTGYLKSNVSGVRWRSADQSIRLSFRVIDNDANLGDTTGWDTYNGKVMLDGCNVMLSSTISDTFVRELIVVDNRTGITYQDSPWDVSVHGSTLTLRANNKAQLWDLRQLVHALKGRQVSFYVPTFSQDLLPVQNLVSGSTDLVIQNIGYTQFVHGRQGKDRIWVRLKDGTVYTKQITAYVVSTSTTETLSVNSNWGANVSLADIDRISYLEEVRFDTDELVLQHNRGDRLVHLVAPVISVI